MQTIIAGSRNLEDYNLVIEAVSKAPWEPTVVVSGGAKGIDSLAEQWAVATGIPCEKYPANWKKYGRAAGPIRNKEMAEKAEALIAIWDGKSNGTKNMIALARKAELSIFVYRVLDE